MGKTKFEGSNQAPDSLGEPQIDWVSLEIIYAA
jgi:hypothetical protein